MKNILLFIVVCITTITNTHAQEFKLKNYQFNIQDEVISAAYFNNKFYCLESDGKVFHIDSLCNVKYIANVPISSISIININDSLFITTKSDSTFYFKENKFSFIKKNIHFHFFEDERYIVEKSCSGEWGGSVYFINKSDKKIYECAATCPIVINKISNSYIITASLAHLATSTQILKIDDPKNLTVFKKRKRKKINYVGDNESKAIDGAEIIVDSIGAMTICSYAYDNKLFHIVVGNENQGTSLCKIENNKFQEIIKISEKKLWSYTPINIRYGKDEILSVFQNRDSNGFLFIDGNNITIYSFYN